MCPGNWDLFHLPPIDAGLKKSTCGKWENLDHSDQTKSEKSRHFFVTAYQNEVQSILDHIFQRLPRIFEKSTDRSYRYLTNLLGFDNIPTYILIMDFPFKVVCTFSDFKSCLHLLGF